MIITKGYGDNQMIITQGYGVIIPFPLCITISKEVEYGITTAHGGCT